MGEEIGIRYGINSCLRIAACADLAGAEGQKSTKPAALRQQFRAFDRRELALIEPLRTLRLIHYSAWLARRWDDPTFRHHFAWFGSSDYWQGQVQMLDDRSRRCRKSRSSSEWGTVLWTPLDAAASAGPGPHFVDLDDARTGKNGPGGAGPVDAGER